MEGSQKPQAANLSENEKKIVVNMAAPWEGGRWVNCLDVSGETFGALSSFLQERSRLHEVYIREEAKTKRLTLFIAASFFMAGCLTIMFAPERRESVFQILGVAMLVVAAGSVGYKRIWGKSKFIEVTADQGQPPAAKIKRPAAQ